MKLYAISQAKAQEYADRAHAYLLANDSQYADSVAKGYTKRWAFPMQDKNGWYINVEERCIKEFSDTELLTTAPLYVKPTLMFT